MGTPDGLALAAGDERVGDSLVGLGLFRRHLRGREGGVDGLHGMLAGMLAWLVFGFSLRSIPFQFLFCEWTTRITLDISTKKNKGSPCFFFLVVFDDFLLFLLVCGNLLLAPRTRREILSKGVLHIIRPHRVEGCKLEYVNLLVRLIQNNVPDGREARGESVAGRNALGDECFVGRIVLVGAQLEVLDFFQVVLADADFMDEPHHVVCHRIEVLDKRRPCLRGRAKLLQRSLLQMERVGGDALKHLVGRVVVGHGLLGLLLFGFSLRSHAVQFFVKHCCLPCSMNSSLLKRQDPQKKGGFPLFFLFF